MPQPLGQLHRRRLAAALEQIVTPLAAYQDARGLPPHTRPMLSLRTVTDVALRSGTGLTTSGMPGQVPHPENPTDAAVQEAR